MMSDCSSVLELEPTKQHVDMAKSMTWARSNSKKKLSSQVVELAKLSAAKAS